MFLTEEKNDLESTLESILYINLEDLIKLDTYFSSKENESLEILLNDKIEEIKSKYQIIKLGIKNLNFSYSFFNPIPLLTGDTFTLIL